MVTFKPQIDLIKSIFLMQKLASNLPSKYGTFYDIFLNETFGDGYMCDFSLPIHLHHKLNSKVYYILSLAVYLFMDTFFLRLDTLY